MNNPEKILAALDRHLDQRTRIILYGRAALALGYPGAAPELGATVDVDAILPSVEMAAIENDRQFWQALDLANRDLEPEGLYMTHLFSDDQVILTPDWLLRIVALPSLGWRHLQGFRPSTLDLILTKMMREDPQDLADIQFLLRQELLPREMLHAAFSTARVPAIDEIHAAFAANQPRVLALALN
ncbi:MAG: hypothetical protein EXS37_12135 [Opitutus sp.]|nr:hypothetical protein [Opitutus sp.]